MQMHDLQFETLTDLVKKLADGFPNIDRDSIFRERWTTIKKHIGDYIFDKYREFKKAARQKVRCGVVDYAGVD